MSEREVNARVVVMVYDCDECGEEMKYIEPFVSYGELWEQHDHHCANGHVKMLNKKYPRVEFRRLSETDEHARACGTEPHSHGLGCNPACPTCRDHPEWFR